MGWWRFIWKKRGNKSGIRVSQTGFACVPLVTGGGHLSSLILSKCHQVFLFLLCSWCWLIRRLCIIQRMSRTLLSSTLHPLWAHWISGANSLWLLDEDLYHLLMKILLLDSLLLFLIMGKYGGCMVIIIYFVDGNTQVSKGWVGSAEGPKVSLNGST